MLKGHHLLATCIFTGPSSGCFWSGNDGAFGDFVSASTGGAPGIPLLPWALGYNVSHLPASESPDNLLTVWVIVMEDGHFHCSPSTRWEWDYGPNDSGCFSKRGTDMGVCHKMTAHGLTRLESTVVLGAEPGIAC